MKPIGIPPSEDSLSHRTGVPWTLVCPAHRFNHFDRRCRLVLRKLPLENHVLTALVDGEAIVLCCTEHHVTASLSVQLDHHALHTTYPVAIIRREQLLFRALDIQLQ